MVLTGRWGVANRQHGYLRYQRRIESRKFPVAPRWADSPLRIPIRGNNIRTGGDAMAFELYHSHAGKGRPLEIPTSA
jgi:hypothetical protein